MRVCVHDFVGHAFPVTLSRNLAMSYLCAARPVLLAVPPENLASRIVSGSGAGLTAPSDDPETFVQAAGRLFEDPELRERCARGGRSYAETTFDIEKITDHLEQVLRPGAV